jgi:hypothetical protein
MPRSTNFRVKAWPAEGVPVTAQCPACYKQASMKTIVAEVLELDSLKFKTEKDRQHALEVIEDLMTRASDPAKAALYAWQRERLRRATITEKSARDQTSIGIYPGGGGA